MNTKEVHTDTLNAKEILLETFGLERLSKTCSTKTCTSNDVGKICLINDSSKICSTIDSIKMYSTNDNIKISSTNDSNVLTDDENGFTFKPDFRQEHMQQSFVKLNGSGEVVVEGHSINSDIKAMYEHEGDWEDESEDDEDWDPNQDSEPICLQWFCTNCTCSNSEENIHCQLCGEHRESGILKKGYLASTLLSEKDDDIKVEKRVYTDPDATSTAIGFDERMLLHFEVTMKPNPHPERPDRLRAIMGGLEAAGLYPGCCCQVPAREATRAEMEMVHTQDHIDAVESTSAHEASLFTADTYANCHSALAARLAAGLCIDLATAILKGQISNGFALVRPPGHHALDSTVMGFCLHNNAAVAAKAALAAGAKKIMILDWDVHHGNGTQAIFDHDSSVLYISLHRYEGGRFYPGTGGATEIGVNNGAGFSVNIPWPCGGIGDEDYIFAFQHVVVPIATQFSPDLIIISAGFDAAKGDPLGGCKVSPEGYAHMTQMLYSLVQGKLLVVLEGGYNLRSISASSAAVLKVLLGESPGPLPLICEPTIAGLAAIMEVCNIQQQYWKIDPVSIMTMRSQFRSKVKGKHARKHVGGPIWWKWGRKRVVYDHWFSASRVSASRSR